MTTDLRKVKLKTMKMKMTLFFWVVALNEVAPRVLALIFSLVQRLKKVMSEIFVAMNFTELVQLESGGSRVDPSHRTEWAPLFVETIFIRGQNLGIIGQV